MATALDIVNTAQKQVGFVEGTNNDNPYGTWYEMNHEPYCAMFVSWVFAENNLSNLVAAQTTKGFAYCPAGLSWFQREGRIVDKYSGEPGDIVFYSFAGNGQADHVEIIVNASKDGITTVGGNTSPDHALTASQANGNGVYLRHRPYLYVLAIARPAYTTPLKSATSMATKKPVAVGTAAATALGAGGVAVHQSTTPATTKSTTVLLPAVAQNTPWTSTHITALKTFQKRQGSPQTGIVDKSTYIALMKELP